MGGREIKRFRGWLQIVTPSLPNPISVWCLRLSRVTMPPPMFLGLIGDGLRVDVEINRHRNNIALQNIKIDPKKAHIQGEINKARHRAARAMTIHQNTMRAQARIPRGIPRLPPPGTPPPPPTPPDQAKVDWARGIELQRNKCCQMMDTLTSLHSPLMSATTTRPALMQPIEPKLVREAASEAKATKKSQACGGRKVRTGWARTGGVIHSMTRDIPQAADSHHAGSSQILSEMAQQRKKCSHMMKTLNDLQMPGRTVKEPTKLTGYLERKQRAQPAPLDPLKANPLLTSKALPTCVMMSGECGPMMFAY